MTETEWRKCLKAAHLCRECKKQDAYTLGGRTYCAECAAKGAERKRKARQDDEYRKRDNLASRKWHAEKAASGLCVYCGKRKPESGRKVCRTCSKKMWERKRDKRIEAGMNWPRGANGYCWLCNKRKAIEGKKLCQVCYEKRMTALTPEAGEKGRETMRRMGYVW